MFTSQHADELTFKPGDKFKCVHFSLFPDKSVIFFRGKQNCCSTKFGLFLTAKYCQHKQRASGERETNKIGAKKR